MNRRHGPYERVLHGVVGVLLVVQDLLRRREHARIQPTRELLGRAAVSPRSPSTSTASSTPPAPTRSAADRRSEIISTVMALFLGPNRDGARLGQLDQRGR